MPNLLYAERSDTGLVRENNEDACVCLYPADAALRSKKGALFVMADGLGGMDDGEIASREAVACAKNAFEALSEFQSVSWLKNIVAEANARILQLNLPKGSHRMATTLTLSLFLDKRLYIAHVGDCRVYRVRANNIERLTTDHAAGRHLLIRAVGTEKKIDIDLYDHMIKPGDRIVQCSDGLYSMLTDEAIANEIRKLEPADACEALVAMANRQGGADNISLQVIHVQ